MTESDVMHASIRAWRERTNPRDEDETTAFVAGWAAGRDWARDQAEQDAAAAAEMEADICDRLERARGPQLHDFWGNPL